MTEEQRAELKAAVAQEIETLTQDITRLAEESKPVAPDNAIGRLTRMEAINAQQMNQANLRRAKQRLTALQRTLPRIDEDEDFGICLRCDRAIPIKRLLLVPESKQCVRCSERR